jgi:hypothetical protein
MGFLRWILRIAISCVLAVAFSVIACGYAENHKPWPHWAEWGLFALASLATLLTYNVVWIETNLFILTPSCLIRPTAIGRVRINDGSLLCDLAQLGQDTVVPFID